MRLSTRPPKPVDEYEESESQELVAWRMGLISPNGPNKVRWDWFVLMLVFYTSISLPFGLGFVPFNDWSVNALEASIDLLVDILYIVDIVRASVAGASLEPPCEPTACVRPVLPLAALRGSRLARARA